MDVENIFYELDFKKSKIIGARGSWSTTAKYPCIGGIQFKLMKPKGSEDAKFVKISKD